MKNQTIHRILKPSYKTKQQIYEETIIMLPYEEIENIALPASQLKETSIKILSEKLNEILDEVCKGKDNNKFRRPSQEKWGKTIVEKLSGINGYSRHTLEDISNDIGITRERARQIYAKVIEDIRQHPKTRQLKDY